MDWNDRDGFEVQVSEPVADERGVSSARAVRAVIKMPPTRNKLLAILYCTVEVDGRGSALIQARS
jgi:hypothetical protein